MNSFVNSFFSSFNKSNLVRREQVITYNPKLVTGTAGDLSLWLDAADINNSDVQPTNGTYITTWKDKSDYGNDASSVGVLFQINTLNSFPSLRFQDSDDSTFRCNINKSFSYNGTTRSSIITGNEVTIFIVSSMSPDSSDKARPISFSIDSTTNDFDNPSSISIQRELSGVTDQDTTYGVVRNNASVYQTYDSTVLSYNKPYITKVIFNGTNGTINSLVGSSTNNDFSFSSSQNLNIQYCRIGGHTNDNNMDDQGLFKGYISEILVYNKLLDLNQTKIIEGYLSWKWGLQSTFPTGHPYIPKPPSLITSFTNQNTTTHTCQLSWTYLSTPFELDIYRNNVKIASKYIIKTTGLLNDDYFDITLLPGTTYTYSLYAVNDTKYKMATITVNNNSVRGIPNLISNLSLWLDANDVNNNDTFPSNFDRIKTWKDKSGNNNHATTSDTNGIRWDASGLNLRPSFYFDKILYTYFFGGNLGIAGDKLTIFMVSNTLLMDPLPQTTVSLGTNGSGALASNANTFWIYSGGNYSNAGGTVNRSGGEISDGFLITKKPFGEPYLTKVYFDGTKGYFHTFVGSDTLTNPNSFNSSGNYNIQHYRIGDNVGSSNNNFVANAQLKGYISEVIIYKTLLSSSEREVIEGYLSWKWGLESKIPSTHPYKNAPPTTGANNISSFTNVGTIYRATQLRWTYYGATFNIDIYRNNTILVSNYGDSSSGGYFDASLNPSTTYFYTLKRVGGTDILAKVRFTTPARPNPPNSIKWSGFTTSFHNTAINHDGSVIMLWTNNRLYYSLDRGDNFINSPIVGGVLVSMCMNWAGTFMYVLIGSNAYYSNNSGTTWNNSGTTWNNNGTIEGLPNANNYNDSIACNHIGNRIIFTSCLNNNIFISYNFGLTYSILTSFTQTNDYISNINFMTATPDFSRYIVYRSNTGGTANTSKYVIGTSTNYGSTFTNPATILSTSSIFTNETTKPAYNGQMGIGYDISNSVWYATNQGSLFYYKSNAAGTTWTAVTSFTINGVNYPTSGASKNTTMSFSGYGGKSSLDMSLIGASINDSVDTSSYYTIDRGSNWIKIPGITGGSDGYTSSGDGSLLVFNNSGKIYIFRNIAIASYYTTTPIIEEEVNGYYIIRCITNNSITFKNNTTCNVLIVGGGGQGGGATNNVSSYGSGGGGGGSVGIGRFTFLADRQYNITIGLGGTQTSANTYDVNNGGNTTVSDSIGIIFQAFGGGAGGVATSSDFRYGKNGGSGGGHSSLVATSYATSTVTNNSYSGSITFFGNNGGTIASGTIGGGGGGADSPGNSNGTAGAGKTWYITNEIYGKGGKGGNSSGTEDTTANRGNGGRGSTGSNNYFGISGVSGVFIMNPFYIITTPITEETSNTFKIIQFKSSNSITFYLDTTVDILIVGGGGAGGGSSGNNEGGGGGGAGSVGMGSFTFLANIKYDINIGLGGTSTDSITNTNGGNTTVSTSLATVLQAIGGGKGMNNDGIMTSGGNGGSGGGASNVNGLNQLGGTSSSIGYTGFTFYGNNGGIGIQNGVGGGGGGANSAGSSTNGTAGTGKPWTISGTNVFSTLVFGQGGYGGNGIGTTLFIPDPTTNISGFGGKGSTDGGNGTPANSGNGGGGGGGGNSKGGDGASGLFVIRFRQ